MFINDIPILTTENGEIFDSKSKAEQFRKNFVQKILEMPRTKLRKSIVTQRQHAFFLNLNHI
jgi:hypothetical protein